MRLRDYVTDAIVDYLGLLVFALVTLSAVMVMEVIHFGSVGPTSVFWLVVLGFILACIAEGVSWDFLSSRVRR